MRIRLDPASALLPLLSLALWFAWYARAERGSAPQDSLQPSHVDARAAPCGAQADPGLMIAARLTRQAAAHPKDRAAVAELPPNGSSGLVRVHGDVRRAGRPIGGFALSFEPLEALEAGGPAREGDWDFTDEHGSYEVELPAARYLVREEDGRELADVVIPDGRAEFALDFELGAARTGCSRPRIMPP